jgi:membrane protease YdiL (CAAX protease family)
MVALSNDDAPDRADGFAAGGTLSRPAGEAHPSEGRRIRLLMEFATLFVAAPVAMRIAVYDYGVPLFYALPPVLLGFAAFLFLDSSFSLGRELNRRISHATLNSILTIFAAGCAVVGVIVAASMPERLFALAAERPGKWLKIMTLYPFTSVLAQECVYRVFLFHRYGPLFRNRSSLILTNGLVFGFGHILFRNWIAVVGSFIVGILLAWRYERTRSFWAVYLEHVLWGWLVFTIGLGVYFFTGVRNPAW